MGYPLATTEVSIQEVQKLLITNVSEVQVTAFFASSPPSIAIAAITTMDVLEESLERLLKSQENFTLLWGGLSQVWGLKVTSNVMSPLVCFQLKSI